MKNSKSLLTSLCLALGFLISAPFAQANRDGIQGIGDQVLSEGTGILGWTYQLLDVRSGKTTKGKDCHLGFFRIMSAGQLFSYHIGYYAPGAYQSFRSGGNLVMTGRDGQLLADVYLGRDVNLVTQLGAFQSFRTRDGSYTRIARDPEEDQKEHAKKHRITRGEVELHFDSSGRATSLVEKAVVYRDFYFTWPWNRYKNKRVKLPPANVSETCTFTSANRR